jgi:hypothetical protein
MQGWRSFANTTASPSGGLDRDKARRRQVGRAVTKALIQSVLQGKLKRTMRYTPKTLDEVRRCLGGCPGETQVEVENGIPVTARTVADLRALSAWPPGDWVLDVWVLDVKDDQRCSVVTVEWPSYTGL